MKQKENRQKNTAKRNAAVMQCRRTLLMLTLLFFLSMPTLMAQCALCTKTAQQLGDGPASGLNKGILYLMCIPLGILSIIGYKWYKKEQTNQAAEAAEK